MRIQARTWEWLAPVLVTIVAALPRFIALAHPAALVFDETYYVKDAWSLHGLGYEGTWPDDHDGAFAGGDTQAYSGSPSYVVHPPLGKWLIALGMAALGADDAAGWRLATAVAGTALVLVLYLIARRLSGSIAIGAVASGLLAVDGLAIAMSRVALLDGLLALFILLAVYFVVLDHERTRARLAAAGGELFGPVMWRRPCVLAAGIALGAASAVKWSGLFALAGLGLWLVAVDAIDRRRAGIRVWFPSAIIRQGPATFVLLVPIALATHLGSWSGWFATRGGWGRDAHAHPLAAWWEYQSAVYGFHVGLSSGHPYASAAWQWLLNLRPTAMWVDRPDDDTIAVIGSHPNPLAWYAAVIALIALVVLTVRTRRIAFAWPLVGLAITWAPWLLYADRTIFQFYAVAMAPFLYLGLALWIQHVVRERQPVLLPDPTPTEIAYATRFAVRQRRAWRVVVVVFLALALLTALVFLPLSTGIPIPYDLWRALMWLPGWI